MLFTLLTALHFTVPLGAADAFSLETLVTYKNENKGYSIEYPATWTQTSNQEDFDIFIQAPDHGASVSILSDEVQNFNTDQYYTLNLKHLLNEDNSIQIKDNCKTQINGIPAFWLRYTRMDKTAADITQYLFVNNRKGYVITVGTTPATYPQYRDTLDRIVKSFTKLP